MAHKEGGPPSKKIRLQADIPTAPALPEIGGKKKPAIKKLPPEEKGTFTQECLKEALEPTLMKIFNQRPEAKPFLIPVDPVVCNIPDYLDIIKNPMDLGTIKIKLQNCQYTNPWDFVDDVWTVFENAQIYNKKGTKVYKYALKLSEIFETTIDPVMESLGFCCGKKHTYTPEKLLCHVHETAKCTQKEKNFIYEKRIQSPALLYDKYCFCQKSFNNIPGDVVPLRDDPSQPQIFIPKSDFVERKNDDLEKERFITCHDCSRKFHEVCVLHYKSIWPEGFICDSCHKSHGTKRKENRFTASYLHKTHLSTSMESRVNNFLRKKQVDSCKVYIRVIYKGNKILEVKPGMKKRFGDTGEMGESFPYQARTILAFQEIDGVDVCFFGMHVQEYGSDCPEPNARRVYIAYLDSVHFFRPQQHRTSVYHEILLGYLDYMKKLGYIKAHIWACPPSEGDEYIFNCHPTTQKTPTPKQLQEWYKKMLSKGIIEGIVLSYEDIFKQAIMDDLQSPAELPYFEGDFWPSFLEEGIKNSNGSQEDLKDRLLGTMKKRRDAFYTIHLHAAQSAANLGSATDRDPLISCDLMDGREAFLNMASEKHLEFSSLRRSKFSTMVLLYKLHHSYQFLYACKTCSNSVETRFHCTVCEDFDLCATCYKKDGHHHKMKKLGYDLDAKGSGINSDNPCIRQHSIKCSVQSLIHACNCHDVNCELESCRKFKKVLLHTKTCIQTSSAGCPICRQILLLCSYHSKSCIKAKCSVQFCELLKQELSEQQLQCQLQKDVPMNHRFARMNQHAFAGTPAANSDMGEKPTITMQPGQQNQEAVMHHQQIMQHGNFQNGNSCNFQPNMASIQSQGLLDQQGIGGGSLSGGTMNLQGTPNILQANANPAWQEQDGPQVVMGPQNYRIVFRVRRIN